MSSYCLELVNGVLKWNDWLILSVEGYVSGYSWILFVCLCGCLLHLNNWLFLLKTVPVDTARAWVKVCFHLQSTNMKSLHIQIQVANIFNSPINAFMSMYIPFSYTFTSSIKCVHILINFLTIIKTYLQEIKQIKVNLKSMGKY